MCAGVVRCGGNGVAEGGDRRGRVAKLHERHAEIDVRRGAGRCSGNRATEGISGLGELSGLVELPSLQHETALAADERSQTVDDGVRYAHGAGASQREMAPRVVQAADAAIRHRQRVVRGGGRGEPFEYALEPADRFLEAVRA